MPLELCFIPYSILLFADRCGSAFYNILDDAHDGELHLNGALPLNRIDCELNYLVQSLENSEKLTPEEYSHLSQLCAAVNNTLKIMETSLDILIDQRPYNTGRKSRHAIINASISVYQGAAECARFYDEFCSFNFVDKLGSDDAQICYDIKESLEVQVAMLNGLFSPYDSMRDHTLNVVAFPHQRKYKDGEVIKLAYRSEWLYEKCIGELF